MSDAEENEEVASNQSVVSKEEPEILEGEEGYEEKPPKIELTTDKIKEGLALLKRTPGKSSFLLIFLRRCLICIFYTNDRRVRPANRGDGRGY